MGLLISLDPVRIGVMLLIISRPRPAQNLVACWLGWMISGVAELLVPLLVLHSTPRFSTFANDLANPATPAGAIARRIEFGVGVLALSIAVVMTMRSLARRRVHLNSPTAISRPMGHAQDAPADDGSAIRRLLGRAHNAWENGSIWVALVVGLGWGVPPSAVVFGLGVIATSEAAIGAQVSAVIAFVVGMLAVVEVVLVGYLAAPAKTQAVLQQLHDLVRPRRQQVLVAIFALAGVSLVIRGAGII
jgi:hypothetical protein